jgi:hypothetical protein
LFSEYLIAFLLFFLNFKNYTDHGMYQIYFFIN